MKSLFFVLTLVLSTSAFAGDLQSLVTEISANQPKGLCLSTADGCAVKNSEQVAKILESVARLGSAAARETSELEAKVQAELAEKSARVATFPQAKMAQASLAKLKALTDAYTKLYSTAGLEAALAKLTEDASEVRAVFTAWETEATAVTAGRAAYLTGMRAQFKTREGLRPGDRRPADGLRKSSPFARRDFRRKLQNRELAGERRDRRRDRRLCLSGRAHENVESTPRMPGYERALSQHRKQFEGPLPRKDEYARAEHRFGRLR
jgi:hypothetical protein